MLELLKAFIYFICHPYDTIELTVVRRYADAQTHFIGELYEGKQMIGASCDNFPLNADTKPLKYQPSICWELSFLDPLPAATLRVGALEPKDNAKVQAYIALRRFNPIKVTVMNRFVEHVLEGNAKV